MAREYARLLTSIWDDKHFIALHSNAQRIFILALSQKSLSLCGVTAYSLRRWALLAPDTTEKTVAKALADAEETRFVVIDRDTEEVWVRSFLKHDESLKLPNLVKAVTNDFEAIYSQTIRDGIIRWFKAEYPEGFLPWLWEKFPRAFPDGSTAGLSQEFLDAIGEPKSQPIADRLADGLADPDPPTLPRNALNLKPEVPPKPPAPAPPPLPAEPAEFVEFWQAYPRKTGKPAALKAWKHPSRDPQAVLDGLKRWCDFWAAARTEPQFVPHPATWLNQRRWEDDPPPVVNGRQPGPPHDRPGWMSPNGTWVEA